MPPWHKRGLSGELGVASCRWVPVKERSRSLSLVYSGMFLGSILGLSTSPKVIESMGWPALFHVFGSFGIIWFFVWQVRCFTEPVHSGPATHYQAVD